MRLADVLLVAAVSGLLVGIAAALDARLRAALLRGSTLALVLLCGVTASLLALLRSSSRRSGTGVLHSYGYPKPYRFEWTAPGGEAAAGWNPLYFAGNTLFYVAVFAVAGALVLLLLARMRRRPPTRPAAPRGSAVTWSCRTTQAPHN